MDYFHAPFKSIMEFKSVWTNILWTKKISFNPSKYFCVHQKKVNYYFETKYGVYPLFSPSFFFLFISFILVLHSILFSQVRYQS